MAYRFTGHATTIRSRSTPSSRRDRRPTNLQRAVARERRRADRVQRRAFADRVDQAILQLSAIAQRRLCCCRRRAAARQFQVGRTSTTTRCLDARRVGVPLVRQRWDRLNHRSRRSIRISPTLTRHRLRASVTHPNATTAWRVGLRRRQPAGARVGGLSPTRSSQTAARGDMPFRAAFRKLLNFTGGLIARTSPVATSFRAASSSRQHGVRPQHRVFFGPRLLCVDGTAWMAVYSLTCSRLQSNCAPMIRVYGTPRTSSSNTFYIADAMNSQNSRRNRDRLWDPQDEFYYDQLPFCRRANASRPRSARASA